MKTLSLTALALCLACSCSYAQKTKPAVILGTWELVSASYNGQAETEAPHGILKVYDEAGNYQLISVTVQGTLMSHHGKYALKSDSVYTETLGEAINPAMVGKTYPITFRLVNNELKTTGSFDVGEGEERAYSETWRKVEMAKP